MQSGYILQFFHCLKIITINIGSFMDALINLQALCNTLRHTFWNEKVEQWKSYRNGKPESSMICQYVCQLVLFVQPTRSLTRLLQFSNPLFPPFTINTLNQFNTLWLMIWIKIKVNIEVGCNPKQGSGRILKNLTIQCKELGQGKSDTVYIQYYNIA